jgi:arginine decarboxylase-like protein
MELNYIKRVQDWVDTDNKLLKLKEDMKDPLEKKKQLEEEIITYVESNKLDSLCLNISDGTIKFSKRNQTQALSMRVIRTLLESYSENDRINVDEICDFITSNLEKKMIISMKRDIKDNS